MKFEVKVGTEFKVSESTDNKPVPVTVHVTVANPESPSNKKHPKWKWVVTALVVVSLFASVPALAYGLATGDYALLKALAGHLNDILAQAAKLAGAALNTK